MDWFRRTVERARNETSEHENRSIVHRYLGIDVTSMDKLTVEQRIDTEWERWTRVDEDRRVREAQPDHDEPRTRIGRPVFARNRSLSCLYF